MGGYFGSLTNDLILIADYKPYSTSHCFLHLPARENFSFKVYGCSCSQVLNHRALRRWRG